MRKRKLIIKIHLQRLMTLKKDNEMNHHSRRLIAMSIIVKDDSPDWKSKPVLAIYMDIGDEIEAGVLLSVL